MADAFGTVLAPMATSRWTVDTTPPNTVIVTRVDGYANPPTATFTFIATHTLATGNTFECKLDSGAFEPCVSPKVYTLLKEGSHRFQVRASDSVGNTDPTPTTARWSVGAPGPNTLIDIRPKGWVKETTANFTFHATEIGSILTDATFECRLDSATFAPCSTPLVYTGLELGYHKFQVRATDAAGLTDVTPTTAAWKVVTDCNVSPGWSC
jgi:hypothetical protein